MKKITLLFAFVVVALFANAADWIETFGPNDAVKGGSTGTYWPYVSGSSTDYVYTNYDNAADCTYGGWKASVRQIAASTSTDAIGNHVWIGIPTDANGAYLSISGIVADGAKYVSFDVATASGTSASFGSGDLTTLGLTVNDVAVTLPSYTFTSANVMFSVRNLPVEEATAFSIKLANTSTANGYRIDNISFTALPTALSHVTASKLNAFVANSMLMIQGVEDGAMVDVYTATGARVISQPLSNGKISMVGMNRGVYVVRTGKLTAKVVL